MRIVSYNILDGGQDRLDLLHEVIALHRPDVVGLVEAESLELVEQLARRLEMDFVQAVGNVHASALLSRFPIRDSINHAPLQRELKNSLLEATITQPDGTEWTFGVLHLRAHGTEADETAREKEIAIILEIFRRHREARRPHLLMGDFNSNAPYQVIDVERCKPRTRGDWQKNGGHLPRRVVQRILDAGYRDSLREVDAPSSEMLGSFSTEFPGQRVDYIFTHGIDPRRLRSAWIERGGRARDASDHFPIGAAL